MGAVVAEKQFENLTNMRSMNKLVLTLLVGQNLATVVSTYAPWAGLGEHTNHQFSEELVCLVTEIVVILPHWRPHNGL